MLCTDEQIKKDVVDQLFWDSRLDAASIETAVVEGVVNAYWKKQPAEELAYQAQRVSEVENRFGVTPATGGGDEIIARNVLETLRKRDQLSVEEIY